MEFGFEWDEKKRQRNIAERGIDFLTAIRIFNNPVLISEDTRKDYGEERFRALGHIDGEYYIVVYTEREANIRIISAWKAGRHERQRYQAIFPSGC